MRLKEKKTLSRIILVALGSCLITGCNTKSSVKQLPEREIVEQVDDNSEETIGSVLDVVGFKVYDAIEGFREYDVILKNNENYKADKNKSHTTKHKKKNLKRDKFQ